jgi:hypothetical protein
VNLADDVDIEHDRLAEFEAGGDTAMANEVDNEQALSDDNDGKEEEGFQ